MIELVDVSKKYGETEALKNIHLTIQKGDIFGIIGLSGAGKSTLIRILATLDKPTTGKIFFNKTDLAALQGKELFQFRHKTGMIFQHFNLLSSRTVAENIALPLEIARSAPEQIQRRVDDLIGLVGLQGKRNAYPSQLSGGEKQRVGIARALANHPEMLLCDEATSALDPKTTHEILELLKTINKQMGVTIILITHEMEVIKRICNQVAVIEKGEIVEQGPVVQIFGEPKHPTTQHFLQTTTHDIPPEFFHSFSPNRKLLRLKFKGQTAGEPNISQIIKRFGVDANILLGWIDNLQNTIIGTLVIELTGTPDGIEKSLQYLTEKSVNYEVLDGS